MFCVHRVDLGMCGVRGENILYVYRADLGKEHFVCIYSVIRNMWGLGREHPCMRVD